MQYSNLEKCAEKLKALRQDSDLTQEQIAEKINIAQKTYSDYELGKIRIPIDSIIILAKFYNVDLNYICGISREKKPYPTR